MDGELLPSLEIDGRGNLLFPRSVSARKKASKTLGSPIATTKVKLHPKQKSDHAFLQRMFGINRWVYNQSVEILNTHKEEKSKATNPNNGDKPLNWKQYLRKQLLNRDAPVLKANPWSLHLGYDIRDMAMTDALIAYSTGVKKLKEKKITHFKLKFRSKKTLRSEWLYFRKKWIEKQGANHLTLKWPTQRKMYFKTTECLPPKAILMDCRIQRTRLNEYYLCIPGTYDVKTEKEPSVDGVETQDSTKTHTENVLPSLKVASLDPGVRTFQTIYDVSDSAAIHVTPGDLSRIFRLCRGLDRLMRMIAIVPSRKKYFLRRAADRLRKKIRNLVDEVHKQLAKFLAYNYDVVFLPKFETSQMIRKIDRKIGKKSARAMVVWSHYRFRERLLHKCRMSGTCKVLLCNEAWTSKTCSACGRLHHTLCSSKVFHCPNPACDITMDRDVNGAKNIFLRNYEALLQLE